MPRTPVVSFENTAYGISWAGTGIAGAIIVLLDADDRVLFKVAFEEAEELLSRLPFHHGEDRTRERHRIIYDYAVEKGFIANPQTKEAA